MRKYMIGLLVFIAYAQILSAADDSGLFDYVASRDEVAVLSMIQEDLDLFNDLGLQINKYDYTILDEQGRVCSIKVLRENACTIGAIFYTSFLQCGSNYCEIKFLVVDELHQNKGYGSFMIKSIFNQMSELTGDGSSMFGPLIDISRCRAFDEGFSNSDFTELPFLNFAPLLHCAIFFNDIEYLEIFIKEGADLNEVYAGNTPLMLAIEKEATDMVLLLIEAGADVNIGNLQDKSLLCYAIDRIENIDIAKALLHAGADMYLQESSSFTMLEYAMMNDNPEFALMLIRAGYDVNHQDKYETSPLQYAVDHMCDISVFEALLIAGADINVTDWIDCTPLDLIENRLSECKMRTYDSYRLRSEIDQLEKIKAILLQAKNHK